MPSDASLANLQPPWQPGYRPPSNRPRRSAPASKALQLSRKLCPEAVAYAGQVLRSEHEETRLRLKAAEIILLHGMPKGDISKILGEESVSSITINIQRHEHPENAASPVLNVASDAQHHATLTITTVPAGSGND